MLGRWVSFIFVYSSHSPHLKDRASHGAVGKWWHWQLNSNRIPVWDSLGIEVKWTEVKSLSHVRLFVTPWNIAYKAPLSTEFPRQEYWSGLPFPSPEDLPNPGIKPRSPTLQADTLPSEPRGKALGIKTTEMWNLQVLSVISVNIYVCVTVCAEEYNNQGNIISSQYHGLH